MTRTFIVLQDCWRWALRDKDGSILEHSEHAFETRELALENLTLRRDEFPDAGVEVREHP